MYISMFTHHIRSWSIVISWPQCSIVIRTHDRPKNHVFPCVYTPYLLSILCSPAIVLRNIVLRNGAHLPFYLSQSSMKPLLMQHFFGWKTGPFCVCCLWLHFFSTRVPFLTRGSGKTTHFIFFRMMDDITPDTTPHALYDVPDAR